MRREGLLLSIITPYYDCLEYIKVLNDVLSVQLRDSVEWIIIDDGCCEVSLDNFNAKVVHLDKNSGCAGVPRNVGLDMARGEYITFVDGDDIVAEDFVDKILEKIEDKDFDYCLMSWRSKNFEINVKSGRPEWNCSVWGIVYRKSLIGDVRFSDRRIAEDYEFNMKVLKGKCVKIEDFMYYYRSNEKGIMSNARKSS